MIYAHDTNKCHDTEYSEEQNCINDIILTCFQYFTAHWHHSSLHGHGNQATIMMI